IYATYTATIIVLYLYSLIKKGFSPQTKKYATILRHLITQPLKTVKEHRTIQILLLLIGVLLFSLYMGFLPHLKENYFLPFHVDEWIHWTYSKSFMESGATAFTNPYSGTGIKQSLEPGFNYFAASFAWLSGTKFNTMFVFMPAIITMFVSLSAFNLGNRHKRPFGLETAFCVAVIPTTCRMMGPSFFVPVALGLLFIIFLVWLLPYKKKTIHTILVPLGLWVIFLIHPPTALAGIIITLLYALMLLFDKEFKQTLLYVCFAFIPIGGAFALSARYGTPLQQVIDAFFGGKYFLDYNLPQIWVSFEHMGIIIWVLAVIGVYFVFSKGETVMRTIGFSALAFIGLIGLYDKLGYGLPIMYERSFMYLFLMICLLAGWGVAEVRRGFTELILDYLPVKNGKVLVNASIKKTSILFPFIVFMLLIINTVPAHIDIPYYHLIDERDYDAFTWIEENIGAYRTPTTLYDKGAVDPFKASAFSAITRLSIVSSTMHPIPGYKHHQKVSIFLSGCCADESFLDQFAVSVVYTRGCVTNENLTKIYPDVYILN
ncbi:MAG: hypothetical protein QCH96_07565, partial [Candidatus Thermoplasmatota archaeon]|nr:hypothetical protein [Candidatus Thermoplasmatota archaeon]